MSTLTSSSTFADVKAAYDDNASYVEDDSATKAAAFVTACRFLLRQLPKLAMQGGTNQVQMSPELIRDEMRDAHQWLASKRTRGGVVHPDFSNLRS